MPPETGYERRVRVGPAAPMPSGSPDAFGAGVGRAVEQLGDTLHRREVEQYTSERRLAENAELTRSNVAFAQLREEMAALSREGRKSDDPGHAERMAQAYEERSQALLDGVASPRVRDRLMGSMANWGASFRTSEADWETLRQGEVAVEGMQEAIAASANRTRRLDQASDYANERQVLFDMFDGMDAPDEVKNGLRKEAEQTLAVSFLQGRIDADPVAARALIDAGTFDDVLEPRQVEALLSGADVGIRKLEVAAAREVAEAEAALLEQVQVLEEAHSQGIHIDDAQFETAIAAVRAAGDESRALKLDGMRADNRFAEIYEAATPLERQNRTAFLAGKKRTASEDREYVWLQSHAGALDSAFEADPAAAIARTSGAPPVNLTDPQTIAARTEWARRQTRATGRYVPPLTRAETGPIRDLYEQRNLKGAFDTLDNFGAVDRVAVAKMVAPDDVVFQELAPLRRYYRDLALDGREVLKGNPRLLKPEDPDVEENMLIVDAQFDQATRFMDAGQRNAVRDIARNILAAQISRGEMPLAHQAMREAYKRALGATGTGAEERGGIKRWGGTGEWFLLPGGVTANGFVNAIARFNRANPDKAPVNPDGSRADLDRLTPVAVGDGWYEFFSGSGEVAKRKDGRTYRIRVRDTR